MKERMDDGAAPVKRPYDGTLRRDRARKARERVIDIAETLFFRDGYAATTVRGIASEAGVSPESVYKSFGGKAGLVRAVYERGVAGRGPVPAADRSDQMSARDSDAESVLLQWSRFAVEVAPRASPIALLVRAAAATDVEAAQLDEELNAQRLARMEHNARRLEGRRGLRRGLTVDEIRDVLFAYTAPELYELLVVKRRWPVRRYAEFMFRGMAGQLLES
jgi:AcrR family transcriptional regulator